MRDLPTELRVMLASFTWDGSAIKQTTTLIEAADEIEFLRHKLAVLEQGELSYFCGIPICEAVKVVTASRRVD